MTEQNDATDGLNEKLDDIGDSVADALTEFVEWIQSIDPVSSSRNNLLSFMFITQKFFVFS